MYFESNNQSLKDRLSIAKSEYVALKKKYSEVKTSIKDEISKDLSYLDSKRFLEFAIMLYYGKYSTRFSMNLPKSLTIASRNYWSESKGQHSSASVYDITIEHSMYNQSSIIGFICPKASLFEALEYSIADLWKFWVVNEQYVLSLEQFKTSLLNNELDLFEVFEKSNRYSTLDIIHEPSLKVSNIIFCILK